jgi:pimeloyl-ACP methyl ester carboxylesterase
MPFFNANGHRLFYREAGSGPLLFILPGNTASSILHQSELDYYGRQNHAVSVDFWGTGQSERLADWPQDWWAQGARDAALLLDHLGQQQAVWMGTSGGAVVALLAAIHHPQRVRAVVADSTSEFIPADLLSAMLADRDQHTSGQVSFWETAHGEDWQAVVDADTRLFRAMRGTGVDWFSGRLGEIRCPVLFTASLSDSLLPHIGVQVANMTAQVPGAQAFLYNGGDHPLMWSAPEPFRAAADSFLLQVLKS